MIGDKQGAIIGHYTIGKTLWKVDTTVNNGPWTGPEACRLKVHDGWVLRMQYIKTLRLLATCSTDRTVKLVDVDSMEIK